MLITSTLLFGNHQNSYINYPDIITRVGAVNWVRQSGVGYSASQIYKVLDFNRGTNGKVLCKIGAINQYYIVGAVGVGKCYGYEGQRPSERKPCIDPLQWAWQCN